VSAYGGCQDEAFNNLADEISQRQVAGEATGEEGRQQCHQVTGLSAAECAIDVSLQAVR
jgi:hypothetical protein